MKKNLAIKLLLNPKVRRFAIELLKNPRKLSRSLLPFVGCVGAYPTRPERGGGVECRGSAEGGLHGRGCWAEGPGFHATGGQLG